MDGRDGLVVVAANGSVTAALDKVKINAPGLKAGEWHHLGVSLSDKLVVFIDGKEAASQPAAMRDFAGRQKVRAVATPSAKQLSRGLSNAGIQRWQRYAVEMTEIG